MKKRLFSGMQPTGELHLGNYMGALRNWVNLINDYDCIFCIVDYHAITIPYDIAVMSDRTVNAAMDYIAGGLDPERCTIFVQSHVREHTELAWILNSVTPLGQLMRMTQFKAKTAQFADEAEDNEDYLDEEDRGSFLAKAGRVNAGLFTYPVLQAADIMLYLGEVVPVGEDQIQHVELTRDIARRFNNRYGQVFPECAPLLSNASRLMGLDAENKMSKSLGNHIPLTATEEQVIELVTRQSVSDQRRQRRKDPGVPEECNLYAWHKIFSSEEEQQWAAEGCRTAGIGCFECKRKVADHINAVIMPIREKRAELAKHPDDIRDILNAGAQKASEIAQQTMEKVRLALGVMPRS